MQSGMTSFFQTYIPCIIWQKQFHSPQRSRRTIMEQELWENNKSLPTISFLEMYHTALIHQP